MSTPPQVEKELQRLRRLPENKVCPNCQKKDGGFGFQAVCMAYKTFVCSDCKSAHQAFSHRCKSVSMSIWNMMEVQSLDERNSGGNVAAAKQWLASMPESAQPTPDSHIDVKKAFVDKAYNKKEWESKGPCAREEKPHSSASQPRTRQTNPPRADKGGAQRTSQSKSSTSSQLASSQVATINLLDDDTAATAPSQGGFAFVGSQSAATPSQALAKAPAPSCNLLDDMLFDPQPSAQTTTPTTAGPSSGSAFSFISASANVTPSESNAAPSGSAFSFIAASDGNQPAGQTMQVSFDPLAAPSTATLAPQLQSPAPLNNFTAGPGAWQGAANQQQPAASCAWQGAANQQQAAASCAWQDAANQQQAFASNQQQAFASCAWQGGQGAPNQQQAAWSQGAFPCGQMGNQYMAAGHPVYQQPWQASMSGGGAGHGPPGNGFGLPTMAGGYSQYPQMAGAPMPGSAAPSGAMRGSAGGAQQVAAPVSRPSPCTFDPLPSQNPASLFDPFDPFAPDPISVHG